MSKREIINEINSFNNAAFKHIATHRDSAGYLLSREFHFVATKFAASGIEQALGRKAYNKEGNAYFVTFSKAEVSRIGKKVIQD